MLVDGFLYCGITGLLLQVVLIVLAAVIYLPFFKVLDAQACKDEGKE